MIGRFTRLGMYEDLLKSGDFIIGVIRMVIRGRTKSTTQNYEINMLNNPSKIGYGPIFEGKISA
jgi:hypothetical protein